MTRLYGCATMPIKISDTPVGRLGRHRRLLHLSTAFSLSLFDYNCSHRRNGVVANKLFPATWYALTLTISIEHNRIKMEQPTENNTSVYAKKWNVKSSRTLYRAGRGRASLPADVIARPPAWTSQHARRVPSRTSPDLHEPARSSSRELCWALSK